MHTTDGWTISTVEQDGEYAGEEMGRVWLKAPTLRRDLWYSYGFGSVALATTAAQRAQAMTQAAFEAWYDQEYPDVPRQ